MKGTQKFNGRIDQGTLDASVDTSKVTQKDYKYSIVDPITPDVVMQAGATADKLTATYITGNTQEKLHKTIANILFVSTTPLKSLDALDLKEWYNNIRKILLAYQIPLPQ